MIPNLALKISEFRPSEQIILITKANSVAHVKSICEISNLFDGSIYPSHIPLFTLLSTWLQKAIQARESAIAYYAEVEKISLESMA